MRRKTYAYNAITIGVLVACLVYFSTKSIALTVLAGLGISVGGFILIKLLENAMYKGVDKAAEKVGQAYQNHKAQKAAQNGAAAPQTTQFPNQPQTTQFPGAAPVPAAPQPAEQKEPETKFCPYCGSQISRAAKFCPACGASLEG